MIRHLLCAGVVAGLLAFSVPARPCDVCGCFLKEGKSDGSPIAVTSAEPLPQGGFGVTFRYQYVRLDRFSDAQLAGFVARGEDGHSVDSVSVATAGIAYGVLDDLTLAVSVPYVHIDDIRAPEVNPDTGAIDVMSHGDSTGIGDATLFAEYRFLHLEDAGFSAALLVGLKTPTGSTGEHTAGGERFELGHQPGSGSWDPLVGLALTKRWDRFSLHASALYQFTQPGDLDTELGDHFAYGIGAVYRVLGAAKSDTSEHAGAAEVTLDLIAEWNGEWHRRHRVAGVLDRNSGGSLLEFSPGFRLGLNAHVSVFSEFGIPWWQDPNGNEHRESWRATGGIGFGF